MTTQYSKTLTLAVPEPLIDKANHLACLMGESAADIETFRQPSYTNGTTDYAVAHTACKPVVTDALESMTLPPNPDHVPPEYDRAQAEAALAAIVSGEILVAVDVDPHEQFKAWGLTAIPSEGEL
ncbi:hypothetical protein [Marinobacter nauticus]|uniref:Uncharacterized protein n=1 Tax=Marinobacter nauticus TaxID=2743 RepID=A0A1M2V0Y2_MARNT|nr:hypothetical protein [Marinobacter nauticus]OJT01240.1 hypothetical protein BEE62_14925 [Marinobacter nauticus]